MRPSPIVGFAVGLGGVLLVSLVLGPFNEHLARSTPALALAVPVAVSGVLGGRRVAAVIALVASAGFSLAFIPPVGSLRVHLPEDAVAVGMFLVVALAAGTFVAGEAERRRAAVARATELTEMHDRLQAAVAERDRFEAETRRLLVLDEVDRQRKALLRAVSHELRTPLGTMRAITTDLQSGTEFDPATRDDLLDVLAGETERLDRIVANLLSMSRIDTGALQPDRQPADVADIANGCRVRLERLFRTCTLEIAVDGMPDVLVDFTQIDQVISNLLENAARHSPPGGVVRLSTTADADFVTVEVTDDGPGVEPSLRAEVFEPFRAGRGGTGLGLAICRAIVEAHGGTIHLGESLSGGARFVFTLPVAC